MHGALLVSLELVVSLSYVLGVFEFLYVSVDSTFKICSCSQNTLSERVVSNSCM